MSSSAGGSGRSTRSGKPLDATAAGSRSGGVALPPSGPHCRGHGRTRSATTPPPTATDGAADPAPTSPAADAATTAPATPVIASTNDATTTAAVPTADTTTADIPAVVTAPAQEPQARVEEVPEQPPVVEVEVEEEAGASSSGSEIAMSDGFEHGEEGAEEQQLLEGAANEEEAQRAMSQATESTTQSKSKRGANKVPTESWVVTKLNKESYPEEPVEAAEKFSNTCNAIVRVCTRIYQRWSDIPEDVKQDCYEAAWKRFVAANDEIRRLY
ncbi:hypothetical protein BRADI_5g08624v3 [Brachypodium distachyon]|uniref:Uncharacterized protein n=1 Tax=Brachypodium distachyon TaxID=15368 RepID=A0A0Q3E7R8_BRADI|nr:hypothetical protein BRADI_5g08624v3 [Brachypodium distachyon]